jgi:hypothetical protein
LDEEGRVEDVELHPSLDLAMGQAEVKFGIPPSGWQRR